MKLMSEYEFKKWFSYFLLILASIVAYHTVKNFDDVSDWFNTLFTYLSPFLAGFVIAYLLDMPCSKLERRFSNSSKLFFKKRARGLSVFVVYILFLLILTLTLNIILPQTVKNITEFVTNFPTYFKTTMIFLESTLKDSMLFDNVDLSAIPVTITLQDILSSFDIKSFSISSIWQGFVGILSVSTYFFNAILAIISSIYLLLETKELKEFYKKVFFAFFSEKNADIILKYVNKINSYFKRYLVCLLFDGLIVGIFSVLGLFVIDVKYAVVLGVVEGVTNMIPYFGAIVGTILVVIIVLFTDGFAKAAMTLVFLFVLQQIDGNIIKPKLFGDSFNISPFLVIFSITLGGSYYGVLGMVIAIPVVAVLKSIIMDIIDYKTKKKLEGAV